MACGVSGADASYVAQAIPSGVLMAVIGGMFAVLLAVLAALWRVFAHRFDKMEGTLDAVRLSMPTLATKADLEVMREQTRASMRSMGDGFDARITKVAERCAIVESDLGKEIAVRQALRDGK